MGCGGCGKKRQESIEARKKQQEALNLTTKVKNFAKASIKHILTGSRIVDSITRKERYNICLECDNIDRSSRACAKCGCFVRTKTRWADQECPLDPPKWKAIE